MGVQEVPNIPKMGRPRRPWTVELEDIDDRDWHCLAEYQREWAYRWRRKLIEDGHDHYFEIVVAENENGKWGLWVRRK